MPLLQYRQEARKFFRRASLKAESWRLTVRHKDLHPQWEGGEHSGIHRNSAQSDLTLQNQKEVINKGSSQCQWQQG